MKRKFNPYLTIDNKNQLLNLLNNQDDINSNFYTYSKVEFKCKEEFYDEVNLLLNFYRFKPKKEDKDFICDTFYHILVVNYYRKKIAEFETARSYIKIYYPEGNQLLDQMFGNQYNCIINFTDNPNSFVSLFAERIDDEIEYGYKYLGLEESDISEDEENWLESMKSLFLHCEISNLVFLLNEGLYRFLLLPLSMVKDYEIKSLFINASQSEILENKKIADTTKVIIEYYFFNVNI